MHTRSRQYLTWTAIGVSAALALTGCAATTAASSTTDSSGTADGLAYATAQIEKFSADPERRVFPVHLVERGTTGPWPTPAA